MNWWNCRATSINLVSVTRTIALFQWRRGAWQSRSLPCENHCYKPINEVILSIDRSQPGVAQPIDRPFYKVQRNKTNKYSIGKTRITYFATSILYFKIKFQIKTPESSFWPRHAVYGKNAHVISAVCYEIAPCINGSTRR